MRKHTPGPWSLPHLADPKVKCNCGYVLSDMYMGSIATVNVDNSNLAQDGGNDSPPLEEAIANARLIAAAPDMYAAMKCVSGSTCATNDCSGGSAITISEAALNRLNAAIANAEGSSE